jgi:hypothetical protein
MAYVEKRAKALFAICGVAATLSCSSGGSTPAAVGSSGSSGSSIGDASNDGDAGGDSAATSEGAGLDSPSSDGTSEAARGAASGPDGGGDAQICTPPCGAGMVCLTGNCAPAPVELTRSAGCGLMVLALSGGTIYFTDQAHGTVSSVPATGGATHPIATGQAMPAFIVADQTAVYWANEGDGSIMRAALLDAGAPTMLVTGTTLGMEAGVSSVNGMAVRGTTLYFSRDMAVWKVPTAGGAAPMMVGTSQGRPTAIAVDDTMAYWLADLQSSVERHALDGSGMTLPVAESQGGLLLDTIDVLGTSLLWAGDATIVKKSVTATSTDVAFQVVSTTDFQIVTAFVAVDTTVYLGEDGMIEKAPLSGGNPVVIADGQGGPSSMLADATNIYWRTSDTCAIMRLAR